MKKLLLLLCAALTIYSTNTSAQVSVDWLRFINDHPEGGASIACDNANNNYALGGGGGFMYLNKRDKFGNLQWQRSSTSYLGENPVRVFVDQQGNPVVVGYRYSSLHEGPFAVALIVLKYAPDGHLLYKTVIPGTYTYFNNSANRTRVTAEMDGSGDVYIATGGIVTGYPSQGFNVVKISSAGNLIRVTTQTFGGSPFYLVSNIRLKGNLLGLTGPTSYYEGNPGVWLLDTAGKTKWSKVITGFGSQDIAIDDNKNTYVLSLLLNVAGANTGDDVTLYKFSNTGSQLWLKGYDFTSSEVGLRMEMTPDKNIAMMSEGTQINGGMPYVDWLTMKLDLNGNLLWSKRYDKTINNDELPRMIAVDKTNNIYITGSGGPFPGGSNLGALQGVTLKYSPKGMLRWRSLIDTLGFVGVDIALGTDTSVFVISGSASAVVHLLQTGGTDACAVPVNLHTTDITDDGARLNWNIVPNAFLYHVEYKTSTGNTWIEISTDSNHYTLLGLFAGTSYDYRVEAVCNSGPTGFSAVNKFNTSGMGYCTSRGLDATQEWINYVLLGAIGNSTESDGGYGDYTNLSTDLVQGSVNSMALRASIVNFLDYEVWRVYIDFNQDGDFTDPGETVVAYKSTQIGLEFHSFTVPANAVLGPTRMRVSMKFNKAAAPCETFSRGEVEDYTVNITSQQPQGSVAENSVTSQTGIAALSVFPNPAKNNLTVTFRGFDGSVSVHVSDVLGKVIYTGVTNSENQFKIDVHQLVSGVYILRASDEKGRTASLKWIKE